MAYRDRQGRPACGNRPEETARHRRPVVGSACHRSSTACSPASCRRRPQRTAGLSRSDCSWAGTAARLLPSRADSRNRRASGYSAPPVAWTRSPARPRRPAPGSPAAGRRLRRPRARGARGCARGAGRDRRRAGPASHSGARSASRSGSMTSPSLPAGTWPRAPAPPRRRRRRATSGASASPAQRTTNAAVADSPRRPPRRSR